MFTRKRWLRIAACCLLSGLELSLWPLSHPKLSLAGFALAVLAMIGFCWGIALLVYLMAALFHAGRRRANPGVQPVKQVLSGLGDEARHRWLARGCRWPAAAAGPTPAVSWPTSFEPAGRCSTP